VEPTATSHMRSPLRRFVRALRLDARAFRVVERDRPALAQAAGVVALGGLARGLFAFADEGLVGVVGSVLAGFVLWGVGSAVVGLVGSWLLGYRTGFRALAATLGFAAAPLVLLALGVLPLGGLGARIVWDGAHVLAMLAMVLAVREALETDSGRALLVSAAALGAGLVGLVLLTLLLGRPAA
jgi:Yip1 domain